MPIEFFLDYLGLAFSTLLWLIAANRWDGNRRRVSDDTVKGIFFMTTFWPVLWFVMCLGYVWAYPGRWWQMFIEWALNAGIKKEELSR